MTFTISLPSEAEAKLKDRARALGQDIARYVEQLIAKELATPISLAEAAEPIATAIDAAGVSDDEFKSILTGAQEEARRHRRHT